jgi:hypothetical protein
MSHGEKGVPRESQSIAFTVEMRWSGCRFRSHLLGDRLWVSQRECF